MMNNNIEYRKLSVDNEKIRKLVLHDPFHYEIHAVPCILVFDSNGNMNKYIGPHAFEYIQTLLQEYEPVIEQPPPPPPVISKTPIILSPITPPPQTFPPEEPEIINEQKEESIAVEPIESTRDVQQITSKIEKKKENSLMSIAQQMEKQREEEEQARTKHMTIQEQQPTRPI